MNFSKYLPAIAAVVVIIILLYIYWTPAPSLTVQGPIPNGVVPPPVPATGVPAIPTERMIAAASLSGLSRGYNGTNAGGYDDAMNTLWEGEHMHLADVKTDLLPSQ